MSCLHPSRLGGCCCGNFITRCCDIWKTTRISKIVRSFKHRSVSVEWYEGYHIVVRLMSHGWRGDGNIGGVFSIRMSGQPLFKHTVNHCMKEDKVRIVRRTTKIFDLTPLVFREVCCNITTSRDEVRLKPIAKIIWNTIL